MGFFPQISHILAINQIPLIKIQILNLRDIVEIKKESFTKYIDYLFWEN